MNPEVRAALKHSMETMLCGLGMTRIARRQRAGQTVVLAYHNIVPTGEPAVFGDRSLHLPQNEFARHLELLAQTHDVVPLEQLHAAPADRRPRAVITFDDAYSGALRAGVAELQKRSMPATVFVAPGFVNGGSFWWDVLAGTDGRGLDRALRDLALNQLAGRNEAIRTWAGSQELATTRLPSHMMVASEADLAAAAATGAVTFGSHTWSHPNLTQLAATEMRAEMARPLEWLSERSFPTVRWVAYPYGLRNDVAERVAAELRLEGALLIETGWVSQPHFGTARFALPRVHVPAGISTRGFEIMTSGLFAR